MDIHPELRLFLERIVRDEEAYSLIQIQLQKEIKDKIAWAKTPEEAFNVKLELDAATRFWALLEEISKSETEGEDDNA